MKRKQKISQLDIYLLSSPHITCEKDFPKEEAELADGIATYDYDPVSKKYEVEIKVCNGSFSSDVEDTMLHEIVHYLQFLYHKPVNHGKLFNKLHRFLTDNLLDKEILRPK